MKRLPVTTARSTAFTQKRRVRLETDRTVATAGVCSTAGEGRAMPTYEVIISGPSPFITSVLRAFAEKSQKTFDFPHIGETVVSSQVEKSPHKGRNYSELTVTVHDVERRDEAVRLVSEALREVARQTGKEEQRDEVTIQ